MSHGRFRTALIAASACLAIAALPASTSANHSLVERISTGPTGGNGAFSAGLAGASTDGTRAFLRTDESLVASDTDSSFDVYERTGGTTTLVSIGSSGGNGAFTATFRGASANGTRVFFVTDESLVAGDTDASQDVYERTGGTTTLVSIGPSGGSGAFTASFLGASADGTRVFLETDESLVAADTDTRQDIYERSSGTTTLVSTGSSGGNDAFTAFFAGVSADGTRVFFNTTESLEAGDTDTTQDVYERSGGTTTLLSIGPSGGGPTGAGFRGASADGTRVFFLALDPLVAGDTDSSIDIYERSGGTTTLVSTGPSGGNGAFHAEFTGASADGTRVFFQINESLVAGDTDSSIDIYERSGGTTTLLSTGPAGGNGAFHTFFRGASADGTRVFLATDESLVAGDTDSSIDVYERSGGTTTLASTGPSGGNGAIHANFERASTDGTRVFFTTTESLVTGDTDSSQDVYERFAGTTTLLSTGPSGGNGALNAPFAGASADGTRVFFTSPESLIGSDTDSSTDLYMSGIAVTTGFPRPKGATPVHIALVPAYEQCGEPNTTHAAPLPFASCNPPQLISDYLTMGSPDANGQPANFIGSVHIGSIVGDPGTPGDQSDASIAVAIVDVRNQAGLTDYTGELQVKSTLRVTDRLNGSGQTLPGTVSDLPYSFTVPCTATPATTTGGSCSVNTSFDALTPGMIAEGKRSIYRLVEEVKVFDGGPDGDVDTPSGATLFAGSGFFIP